MPAVGSLSDEAVRVALRREIEPGSMEPWCIPPGSNAEFVAVMEEGLDVYLRPGDAPRPPACVDEASQRPIG